MFPHRICLKKMQLMSVSTSKQAYLAHLKAFFCCKVNNQVKNFNNAFLEIAVGWQRSSAKTLIQKNHNQDQYILKYISNNAN